MGDYNDDAEALLREARTAYGDRGEQTLWHHFVVLRWRLAVDDVQAHEHLERLFRDVNRAHYRGVRVLAGFHAAPFPHAHALVGLCHRLRPSLCDPQAFRAWLQPYWYHGEVLAQAYDPSRRAPSRGGAIEYTARDPGSVVCSEWIR